jgi:hypothetical protein
MKIAVICCTYLRPKQLGRLLRCFQLQDYENRELLILDDAGQYDNQQGDRWRLVSVSQRFPSLGEKRNAAARLVGDHVEALAPWDDDDLYLPWALSASVAALHNADWSRPALVLHADEHWRLKQYRTGGLYHAGWAYRKECFWLVGGYPAASGPEDQGLLKKFEQADVRQADPIALGFRPFYVYLWGQQSQSYHISGMLTGADEGQVAWKKLGRYVAERAQLAPVQLPFDPLCPAIDPAIYPRPF